MVARSRSASLHASAFSVVGDHVKTDSETELSAFCLRLRPYAFDAPAHHVGRLTPDQVDVDMAGGESSAALEAPPKKISGTGSGRVARSHP